MGTYNGLVSFNPNDIKKNNNQHNVVINDFKLFNQLVPLQSSDPESPLSKPIEFTRQLTLTHQDYAFSLDFSIAEYIRPDKIRFAYKMTGLDEKWLYTDADNRIASYTTLPAGDYVFNVKASNTKGQFSESFSSLKVSVHSRALFIFITDRATILSRSINHNL
jgi:hypothetical protein